MFAVKRDLGARPVRTAPNLIEHAGNAGLWPIERLPVIVWNKMKDPRFVSLALTILALGAVSFAFYPVTTLLTLKAAVILVPISFETAKLSAYILTCASIISYGLRAQGRFWNTPLYDAFLSNSPVRARG